jgi:hypothetical protein
MDIIINFSRPGKINSRYVEGLVDKNPVRLKTLNYIPADTSLKWCEENWWQNGYIPRGVLISSEMKYLFFKDWFSVMQLFGESGDTLGYYVDVITPIRKVGGEYYLTDLFLDMWIAPGGNYTELDRDEFEGSFQSHLITPFQYKKANQVIEMLKDKIVKGDLFHLLT